MSRIGKLPIKVPSNVDITCNDLAIMVKGKFGTLETKIPDSLYVEQNAGTLVVRLKDTTNNESALHGLYRMLIYNMVVGVSEQFKLKLNLKGVGYRASVQGKSLILNLGFSHPVELVIPEGISVEVQQNTTIQLTACDKEKLGLFGAEIKSWRLPEPYKGKGILYEGEIINRKAGKSGKK